MPRPTILSDDRPATRLATRLCFGVAGFGTACWAPLVPFAKERLGIDDAALGLLLLCLGVGSVSAMSAVGAVVSRHGTRPVIAVAGVLVAVLLPMLAVAPTPLSLAVALTLFGAAVGAIDVAMNVHAVAVERAAARPLMSGFHALYSLGGFAGSGAMTGMLSAGVPPGPATLAAAAPMLLAMLVATPRLLRNDGGAGSPLFALPRGIVLLLSLLAAATFLVEGAMLDWSALLVSARRLVPADDAGIGYILFAAAMTAGRLGGDALVARIGDRATLVAGGCISVLAFVLMLSSSWPPLALSGFVLLGLGASNLVPVLFRRAGAQHDMPPALAISALTTIGYAGILLGPALIGFLAHRTSLPATFWLLAALMATVPLSARLVAAPAAPGR